jgi:phosphatidylglycerol:prolipoprotein diacylglycerol transferase
LTNAYARFNFRTSQFETHLTKDAVYPELFSIGGLKFHSFGAMLALAFLTANYLLSKEIERKKIYPDVSSTVTMLTIMLGIAGSKLFHLLENLDRFLINPIGETFSAGGLTFYGGMIVATIGNLIYLRSQKIPPLQFLDAVAPSLMIGYGIGRIGCLLAGDGCYGQPCDLPWAMTFPNGYVPTLAAQNPELALQFKELFPNLDVPKDIPVHPTPIYETLYATIFFAILWKMRTAPRPSGWIFFTYLILQAFGRLTVEFIRLNPPILFGLSEAQVIAALMIASGVFGLVYVSKQPIDTPPNAEGTVKTAARATNKKKPLSKTA